MQDIKKNDLQPHLSKYWKIPPDGNAAFVANMEDVLDLYHLPYDPRFPVVCMDESNKQLVGEVHEPLPMASGQIRTEDHEYVRNGVADIFMEVEPLAGRRHIEITQRRTRQDWAGFIKGMLEERYPQATKVRLVMDNLNTLNIAEIELSVLGTQCLNRRIPDRDTMRRAVSAWESDRNNRGSKTNWQFSTADARIKPKRLCPTL